MDYEDLGADAQHRLDTVVLDAFYDEYAAYRKPASVKHLLACEDVACAVHGGGDGAYGCDTGCEYVRLDAVITCGHGELFRYEYGGFGDIAELIDQMGAV